MIRIDDRIKRVDAVSKARGEAEYLSDLRRDGMLYARMVRSTIPRGRIGNIELPVLFSWWSESLSDMIPIHLSFGIGGFVGYKLSTRSSGLFTTSSYDENGKEYVTEISGDFSSDYDNSFEAGLMADAAVYFGIGSGWSTYGQFSAQFPLTALRDKYQENQNMMYLSSYLFSAGVIYEFGGNK